MKISTIGFIGLGKMGFPLVQNLINHQYKVIAYDTNPSLVSKITSIGADGVNGLEVLTGKLRGRRIIWVMVPAGKIVDVVIDDLMPHLKPNDIIIDGGNSNFNDTVRRHQELKTHGIDFLDCGTSGGVEGALNGACTMIGGEQEVFQYCEQLFKDISIDKGYLYTGSGGSGHYVKMIHNGIEYGMMQSIAEGFEMLQRSDFDIDNEAVAKVWNHGSVIRGWLMELTNKAFSRDSDLSAIKGIMHASGEGQWTVETAIKEGVPTPVIALSLMMRYRSQVDDSFAGKVVAALRNEFGGHKVEKK
ncbi:MAG TPA: phosphogluconate dehydrogenase (NAD(+)-dependent, decarboxylating) [Cyclobacteriaceae bacterium]